MKKLLVVLLSLGLLAGLAMTASAADVKFSGQYYVTGQFESNRGFNDGDEVSLSNFWTRTRLQARFGIAEGLTFTTRFDLLEKQWGNNASTSSYWGDRSNSRVVVEGRAMQENVEFEHGYVTFKTKVGKFDIGYQAAGTFGTRFGDEPVSRPRIKLTTPMGPFTLLAIAEKRIENSTFTEAKFYSAADRDQYFLAGIYKFKGGDAGLLLGYSVGNDNRPASNFKTRVYSVTPYVKATFGPVYMEGEFQYLGGKVREYDVGGTDMDKAGYGAYALAKMKFGPAYAGLSAGFSSGDDDPADDKDNSGTVSSTSWSPGIIFGDANYKTWSQGGNPGAQGGGVSYNNSLKQNLLALNAFGGYNVTPKLNLDMQFWYLKAHKTNYVSKDYGMELDFTATYKIYDNLSYMVGAGYFWTGDYFKGTSESHKVGNDYVLLNKLTLNF